MKVGTLLMSACTDSCSVLGVWIWRPGMGTTMGLQGRDWISTKRNWIRVPVVCILLISVIGSVSILANVAAQAI
jgi:hypothetical protein